MGLVNLIYRGQFSPPEPPRRKDGFYRLEKGEFLVKDGTVKIYHKDVVVENLGNHNFGNYTVTMTRYDFGSSYAIRGAKHPHVLGSRACWGDLHKIAHQFLLDNDAEQFAGISRALLETYFPGSEYGGWWSRQVRCGGCSIALADHHDSCRFCGVPLCSVCEIRCDAGHVWCKDHFGAHDMCRTCRLTCGHAQGRRRESLPNVIRVDGVLYTRNGDVYVGENGWSIPTDAVRSATRRRSWDDELPF